MRRSWPVTLLGGVAACSFTPGVAAMGDASGLVDSDPAVDAAPLIGWSTPVLIDELADAQGTDDPSLTADLLEIYYGSRNAGGFGSEDIWVATRSSTSEPFGNAQPAPGLNTMFAETTAKVTGDGLAIFFASDRLGGNVDIYMATRVDRDSPWSLPARVMELSSVNGDWSPYAQQNLLRIIFCSGATEAQEALYVAERASAAASWSAPARIAELDETNRSECDPIEPHPRAVYYATDYLSLDGTFDIYRAARSSAATPYGSRTAVSEVNRSGFNDRDPWVSADERTMVFASDRNGMTFQLYMATR